MSRPLAVVSEPHLWLGPGRFGGHQYAAALTRRGWDVLLVSATTNVFRVPFRGRASMQAAAWRSAPTQVGDHIWQMVPGMLLPTWLRGGLMGRSLASRLVWPSVRNALTAIGHSEVSLLWLHGHRDAWLLDAIPARRSVLRIIDDYASFGSQDDAFGRELRHQMQRVDAVFACTPLLVERYRPWRQDIRELPNGVEWERFASAREARASNGAWTSTVLYVGAIAEWFDLPLVLRAASSAPDLHFELAGPWKIPKPRHVPANVNILGPVMYDAVPSLCARASVGLIPFRRCALVDAVSPIKAYEYLASGLEVVSTRWPALEATRLPIRFSDDVEGLIGAVRAGMAATDERRGELATSVRSSSWDARLGLVLDAAGVR